MEVVEGPPSFCPGPRLSKWSSLPQSAPMLTRRGRRAGVGGGEGDSERGRESCGAVLRRGVEGVARWREPKERLGTGVRARAVSGRRTRRDRSRRRAAMSLTHRAHTRLRRDSRHMPPYCQNCCLTQHRSGKETEQKAILFFSSPLSLLSRIDGDNTPIRRQQQRRRHFPVTYSSLTHLILHPRPHVLRYIKPKSLHLFNVNPVVLHLPQRFELRAVVQGVQLGSGGAAVGGLGG